MTEKLNDVWEARDFPVLREACRAVDQGDFARVSEIEAATGLSADEVQAAVRALRRQGYVTKVDNRAGWIAAVTDVNGDAYRLVGLHPNPDDDLSDLLVERLLAAAEATTDDEEKTKLQRAAGVFKDISKTVTSSVISATINAALVR